MIAEDYISFETAKLLKEKGFHQPVEFFYSFSGKLGGATPYDWNQTTGDFQDYSCITLWMAMKWLRESHWMHISINLIRDSSEDADGNEVESWCYWSYGIVSTGDGHYIYDADAQLNYCEFQSYEEAAEAAINYCLENLI